MSRYAVSGYTSAGKSSVAAVLAHLVAEERSSPSPAPDAPPRRRRRREPPKITVPRVLVATDPGTAIPYGSAVEVVRCRSLASARAAISSAAGGVAVVDSAPSLYLHAVAGWLRTANEVLDRAGLPNILQPPSYAWGEINRAYQEAILVPGTDVIEVHPAAPLILRDASGVVAEEAEGMKQRGYAQGPLSCGLHIRLDGVRSSSRDRRVFVVADEAGLAVGEVRVLPEFRRAADRKRAESMLRELLGPSIAELIRLSDEDEAAWAEVSEIPDLWPQAQEAAASRDRGRMVEEISALWVLHGLSTTAEKSRALRIMLLGQYFGGALSEDDLLSMPASDLRAGLALLRKDLELHHPAYRLEDLRRA